MFTFIFVLFFANYFQVNAIECMQEKASIAQKLDSFIKDMQTKIQDLGKFIQGTPKGCFFAQPTSEAVLNDEDLSNKYNCVIRPSGKALLSDEGHSCYAQVAIDYRSNEMVIELDLLTDASSKLFQDVTENGEKVVVQYEIKGDFGSGALGMVTRVQCNTRKNCALDELRKLLPNLIQAEERMKIFSKIDEALNEPPSTSLVCLNDKNELALSCPTGAKYCKYEYKSDSMADKSCKIAEFTKDVSYHLNLDFIPDYDVKYRYSELLESDNGVTLDDKASFAFLFECVMDKCNSEDNAGFVEDLLSTFVKNPKMDRSPDDKRQNQYNSPFAQKKAKNRSNSLVSYQWMLTFSLFLRFFI